MKVKMKSENFSKLSLFAVLSVSTLCDFTYGGQKKKKRSVRKLILFNRGRERSKGSFYGNLISKLTKFEFSGKEVGVRVHQLHFRSAHVLLIRPSQYSTVIS